MVIIQVVVSNYPYFEEHYKLITVDLSKRQTLNVDPKAIPQFNFVRNLEQDWNTMYLFIEEVIETIWNYESIMSLFVLTSCQQKWLNITL